jgi:PAS domain S-box-containing protein
MSPTSHLRELDVLRKQVADLTRELRDRDQVFRERTSEIDEEVQDLRERSDMLRAIVTSTASETGENFFPTLVCHLSSVLGVQYALVGEVQQSPIRKIHTIAVSTDGSLVDNFEYPLMNTPCETALGRAFACFERDVRTVFPLFGRLAQLGVEGYCGVPLRAKGGAVIGLLALMDTKPLRNSDRLRSLMTVFASRAGAELDRRHSEMKVQQQQRQLMEAQARAHLGSWDWELDSGTVYWSEELFRIFGYEPGHIAVTSDTFVTSLHPLDRARVQGAIDAALKGGTIYDVECRIIRPDRTIRAIHCRGEVCREVDGRPVSLSSSVLDITDRQRVEEELRLSRGRLQQALRASGTGLWNWNTETDQVVFSEEWKRQLGYSGAELPDVFETWTTLLHPDDREGAVAYARQYRAAPDGDYRQEFRLRHKDGTYRWIEARASFVAEADDRKVHLLGSHTDITDRKRMEETIRESEERYRTLVELSPSGVFVFCEGRIVYVNRTGALLMGAQDPQEILDRPTFEFIHPDYHQEVRDSVTRLFGGGVSVHSAERVYVRLDGTTIPVQVEAGRIMWDGKPAILGMFSDITERKLSEDRVREMNLALTQAMPGISRVDLDGRYLEVNQPYATMLGADSSELLGQAWESTVHPEDLHIARDAYARLLEKGKSEFECRAIRKDGSIFFKQVLMVQSQLSVGGFFGHHCFMRDITERKRTEDALAHLNATLERQVSDRTEALRRSEERFRQFFDHAPNVTCLKGHDGRYLYTNRRFDEVFGLLPGMALGKTDDELFPQELAEQFRSHDREVLTSGRGQEFEEITLQEDGPHTSIVVKFPVTDAAGRLSAIGIIATDVTERNRAQQALRESEARWQQFAESVGSAFWIADVTSDERQVVYVNSAFTFIWGIEREEIYRNWSLWLDSIHPEDRVRVKASHDRFVAGGTNAVFHCEYRIVGRDGHIRWISDRRVRMSGWEDRIAGIAEDITHHKQQLALMVQTESIGKIGGWQFDFLTDRLWWSDETYRLHDTTPEAFSPTVEAALNFYTPESRPIMAEALRKGVVEGQSWDLELELISVKGRRIAVRATGQVDVLEGRAVRAYGTFQDITERKLVEQALQRAHDNLERKVLERTAQLQKSEERYARATAIAKVGVWELDVLQEHYYGDTNLKMLFGYGPEELSTDPLSWLKLVHPDDQSIAMKSWEQVQSRATDACHYEIRMVRRDGSVIWTDVRGHGVRDSTGRLTHLIGATVDISERKLAEQALQESEERFSKVFRTSPHPIGITEAATGRCIEVNDACLELFGFRREEVIGNTTLLLGIWPNLDDRVRVVDRLKAGQPVRNMEFALRAKSGALRYFLASADFAELNGTLCIVTVANDITDRKQAEEALRISEERFAKAFQASPHPVVISELDSGLVLDANEAAWQLFGYRKEEVVGHTTLEIGLWHSVEERGRYLDLLKRQGSIRNMEFQLRSKSGDIRQCLLSSELIELNGKQCSVTVGDDITESRRLERALRLTQFSIDQAVEAVLWLDPDARMFNVNDTACRMFEYSREELTEMTIHDIDPNFPVERWMTHWSYLKQQGALTFEARFWSRTGIVLETDVTVNYLQHEGKEYACMILRDIGERKRAEAALHRSHAFLRQVIDTDPNFIFAKDRDGRFTMANKSIADCYGTTVEDLVGKSDADFNRDTAEVEFFRQKDREVMESLEESFVPEEKITDSAGKTRWLQTVKRPILDDSGQAHMVLGAATDITERKRMEEMLLQRERDLSAALQERERISEDLHDGILQALYAVGLGLEGCKPLIRQQRGPIAAKFMKTLDQGIGQLNQVMGEVRNFIAGLESHVIQGGDFPTALRNLVATMSSSASAKCQARIDEASARQLSTEQALHLINIVREGVSNALRHSGATRITVSLRDLARSVRLTITDNGVGFNTNSVQGVGHGLSNMAARAQKVRGVFSLQSTPRKGTKISLDLSKDVHHAHN